MPQTRPPRTGRRAETQPPQSKELALREALEKRGVLFAENFWCCTTCANSAIDEYEPLGYAYYAFYHEQDAKSAAETGELYLGFGPFDLSGDSDARVLRAGRKIVQAAKSVGFQVDWDGDAESRIRLENFPRERASRLSAQKQTVVSQPRSRKRNARDAGI